MLKPILHLPFNGNAKDSSGNNNDGTVVGATLATDRFGRTNEAYSFDSDSITVAESYVGTYTVACWFTDDTDVILSDNITISSGDISIASGTSYTNGELGTSVNHDWNYVIVSGITLDETSGITIGNVGTLDDFRIYDVSLTPTQVKFLYDNGKRRYGR